jgi:hypothetical protein
LSRQYPPFCFGCWLELWLAGLPSFVPDGCNVGVSSGLCDNNHVYFLKQFSYAITKQTPVSKGRIISALGNVHRTYNRTRAIKLHILFRCTSTYHLKRFWLTTWLWSHLLTVALNMNVAAYRHNSNCTAVLTAHV